MPGPVWHELLRRRETNGGRDRVLERVIGDGAAEVTTSVVAFVAFLASLPPSVGDTTLVGIDGFSGAGKTALGEALGRRHGVDVVSIEEFYPGWDGLAEGPERARAGLADPLRERRTPCWRSWDWERDCDGPPIERPMAGPVVALEGCGAGARVLRADQALTVWVDAASHERERRLRERDDWPVYAPHREAWQVREQTLAVREGLPNAAGALVRWHPDGWLDIRPSPRR